MTEEVFWKIVEENCRDLEALTWAGALTKGLQALRADEIVAWNSIFEAFAAKANRADLRGAAYLVNGDAWGAGRFCYFRSWLIGKGKKVFEAALADPDSLADVVQPYLKAVAGIHGSARAAWREVTGETWEDPSPIGKGEASPQEEKSMKLDDSVKLLFPRLAAMHLDDGAKIRSLEPRLRRLFACACCRRHWDKFTDKRSRFAIEVAERYADGLAPDAELEYAADEAEAVWVAERGHNDVYDRGFYTWAAAAYNAAIPLGWWGGAPAFVPPDEILRDIVADRRQEVEAQGVILRDFILPEGIVVPGAAQSGAIVKLAEEIYRSGAFERAVELATELRDASVDLEMVAHCEEGHSHARGCWVIDLLTGRRTVKY